MHFGQSLILICLVVGLGAETEVLTGTPLPNPPRANISQCALVNDNDRYDCIPRGNATQEICELRGCCWSETKAGIPPCFFQPKFLSYKFKNITEKPDGLEAYLERSYKSIYPNDITVIKLIATYQSDSTLRIKIIDPRRKRYESIFPEKEINTPRARNPLYRLIIEKDYQGFKVVRVSDNTNIFDVSDLANFIYSDQFIQITTNLPSTYLYGLGEHKERFKLQSNWTTYTLYSRDTSPLPNTNLYGSHPFYLCMENSTKSHGLFLKNSNAMDIIIQPSPALTFRTIGGILDFFIFLGPTPSDVLKQYQEIIGKPKMPPYWSLGFHLSKFGLEDLETTKDYIQRNLNVGIPVQTIWNDLDYMDQANDFTYDKKNFNGLPEFVDSLHEQGRKYVVLFDPGVSAGESEGSYPPFDKGNELDIFIKNSSGQNLIAKVWNPVSTVYPDFTHPKTFEYWKLMMKSFHDDVAFDGAWLDMNEPSNMIQGSLNGCPDSELETPPYLPNVLENSLNKKTICMTAKQYAGVQYDLHNVFGISETNITSKVVSEILGERSLVIARSTFPGSGQYAGHWSGDIGSNWEDLRYSIPQLLDFSLFGMPLMGADICGFFGPSNEPLCNRWMQLGAFYPFSRNHNSKWTQEQDPASMGDRVINSSKKALEIRYTLLPYLYTLFWQANQNGSTVARPLLIEFPEDPNTYEIDTSFLWGSGLLIVPVLEENKNSVATYLPKGVWYNYYTRKILRSVGEVIDIEVDDETIPLFIQGGQIIPTQDFKPLTEDVRNSDLTIVAALDENGNANGMFYWDDGISIDVGKNYTLLSLKVRNGTLSVDVINKSIEEPPKIKSIEILGLDESFNQRILHQRQYDYVYNKERQNLMIQNLNINCSSSTSLQWS
ncbi:lysosomal alpha-glucosidase-like isoform X2 [Harmonia axyridis]|uniref:lysosomal alpha-glucosidase-like isoform X2 n=1 Tax=Harmonia axyridis TaxID=115357 RepID=UPI001E277E5D|nr:lysosomal alpha-glucosidase-like isoform X2 [Harmonia axyridis]